jgi:hypothetical protein
MDKNKKIESELRGDKKIPEAKPQGMEMKQPKIPEFTFSIGHQEWDKMKRSRDTFNRVMQREIKKAVRHSQYEYAQLILNAAIEQFMAMEATQVLLANHPQLKDVNKLRAVLTEAVNKVNGAGSIDTVAAEADKIASKKGL